MSNAVSNNLSNQKIQQLLACIGSSASTDNEQIEAAEYDWRRPNYFSGSQIDELSNFGEELTNQIAEKFALLYQSEFDVTIDSVTQHFASEFLSESSEEKQGDYYLGFGTDREHLCGVVGMPVQTATAWTTQLLGDTESKEEPDKELSALEESLLVDIASALVGAFSTFYDNYDFESAGAIAREQMPIELEGTAELCKISFNVKKADSENADEMVKAYFLIQCENLKPILEESTEAEGETSAKDTSKAMLGYVHNVPVCVTAQFASTSVTFEEIINLSAGDILLLGKKVNEPIELIVEGRALFHCRPAKSAGKYAVVIIEPVYDTK